MVMEVTRIQTGQEERAQERHKDSGGKQKQNPNSEMTKRAGGKQLERKKRRNYSEDVVGVIPQKFAKLARNTRPDGGYQWRIKRDLEGFRVSHMADRLQGNEEDESIGPTLSPPSLFLTQDCRSSSDYQSLFFFFFSSLPRH